MSRPEAAVRRRVFVVSAGLDIGTPIAAGLAAAGAAVARLHDGGAAAQPACDGAAAEVPTRFESRAAVEQAFAIASSCTGGPEQVVVSAIALPALVAREVAALDDEHWRSACTAAIKSVLYTLQAAHAAFAGRGGSIVVVGPALALAGAPQLVALATALEGQRGLVKSAARQWGRHGITVNWVAVAPLALSPQFATLPLPVRPDAVPVALGRAPALAGEVAPVIDFLASPAGRAVTGATLVGDGGEWMVP